MIDLLDSLAMPILSGVLTGAVAVSMIRVELKYHRRDIDQNTNDIRGLDRKISIMQELQLKSISKL